MQSDLVTKILASAILIFPPIVSAMSCAISDTAQLAFGRYEPTSSSPADIQGTFYLECNPAFPGEILNVQVRLLPSFPASMTMRNIRTGEWLRYTLYRDPGRMIPVFSDEIFNLRMPLAVATRFPITLYARISPGQDVVTGIYRSRLNMLVEY